MELKRKMTVVIGIECHIQLNTKSKLFCSCTTQATKPNTAVCELCLGFPGSKPVLNKEALIKALKVALALNCKISSEMFFSRKSYFYPDMPKNFQISQYELPLAKEGSLDRIRITRVHLEEDPGRLVHEGDITLVDYNRSGIPLIEVVTEPDFKNPQEVRIFLQKLTTILEYLNVYSRKSEATIRTDANISISGGERVEIKNIGGIKDIERALNYEILRQKNLLRTKQKVVRETRAWDIVSKTTKSLRTKEVEEEYGYIFEPDLTEIEISQKQIKKIKEKLPELPYEKAERFVKQLKINPTDAKVLTSDLILADLFEKVAKRISPLLAAKWLRRELLRVLNYNKLTTQDLKINENHLIDLLSLLESKKITETIAKRILEKLVIKPFSVKDYVKKEKVQIVTDKANLEKICKDVLKKNQQAVKDYKAGEKKALHFLIGKVMKITKGTASPDVINKIMKKLL